MSDIIVERSGSILDIQLNRPTKKNAMTSAMYLTLADHLNSAGDDEQVRVVLWRGAGDSFSAGNDIEDFLKNPPGPGESPQARLMKALIAFDKPLVAAVQGAAIGGGTTMLTHCDFIYAGESAKFQMPFVNLGRVPEFGSSTRSPSASATSALPSCFCWDCPLTLDVLRILGLSPASYPTGNCWPRQMIQPRSWRTIQFWRSGPARGS